MSKIIITIILVISLHNVYSQSFNGVPISGDLPTAISRFKAKGFKFLKEFDNSVVMQGSINNTEVDMFIFSTPITKQVFKIVIYFPKQISWKSLLFEYERYKEILEQKYGQSTNEYSYFSDPYHLGDGYELQAVRFEKCTYATIWLGKENMNLAVEITKYEQVNMTYENIKNLELKKREQEQLNKTIF